jgi:hypothetical protein
MGESADGSMDNKQWHLDRTKTSSDQPQGTEQPDAYVSVFDPVGEPAFKHSKLKPLPSWMNLLPTNVHRERKQMTKANLEHGISHLPNLDQSTENRDPGSRDTPEDIQGSPVALVDIPSLRGGGKATLRTAYADNSHMQRKKRKISFEPTHVANDTNDNDGYQCPRKVHMFTAPPENPSYHPPPPRRRTPYPQDFSRFPSQRRDTKGHFPQIDRSNTAEELVEEPCCPLGSHLQRRKNVQGDRLLPVATERLEFEPSGGSSSPLGLSAQYMDTNLPKSLGAKKNPYTATTGEPILDKIKRERGPRTEHGKNALRTGGERKEGNEASVKNRQVRI